MDIHLVENLLANRSHGQEGPHHDQFNHRSKGIRVVYSLDLTITENDKLTLNRSTSLSEILCFILYIPLHPRACFLGDDVVIDRVSLSSRALISSCIASRQQGSITASANEPGSMSLVITDKKGQCEEENLLVEKYLCKG